MPNLNDARKRTHATQVIYDAFQVPPELVNFGKGKTYYVKTYGCQGNVIDGQVLEGICQTLGYKKANDYITKMMMSLIVDPVVEIQLTENGYKVLTSKGEIFSNIPSYTSEQKVISLDDYSRYPIPQTNLTQADEVMEISLGYTSDCIMIRSKNAKKNIIFFQSQRKHIHIHRDIQDGLKLLIE